MSSDVVVRTRGLAKSYPVYQRPWHRLMQQLFGRGKRQWFREFKALRGVDLDLQRGETVGIVGRNGSGKSTLLQLICGTLQPSGGTLEVNGRIAALLELGSGFNPEFTGRENVYLNGTVLGLDRAELDARYDDILQFADIGEFIDQPVKTYSSGMQVRLAFAVAISVEPDILVVDEALAVGDEAFQRKCFARLERMRESGASILFVTHSAVTVLEICDRAVLLDSGEQLVTGAPRKVIALYHKLAYAPVDQLGEIRAAIRENTLQMALDVAPGKENNEAAPRNDSSVDTAVDDAWYDENLVPRETVKYPSRGAEIIDPHIETMDGRRVNVLRAGSEYVYTYRTRFTRSASGVRFGMLIKTLTGVELAGAVTTTPSEAIPLVAANGIVEVRFTFRCLLAPASYFANAGVNGREGEAEIYLDRRIDVAMFRVMADTRRLTTGQVDLVVSSGIRLLGPVTLLDGE